MKAGIQSGKRVFSLVEIAAMVVTAAIALKMAFPLQPVPGGADVILPMGTPSLLVSEGAAPPGWAGGSSDAIFGRGSSAFGAASTDGTLVLPSAGHMTLEFARIYAMAECRQKSASPRNCTVFLTLRPTDFAAEAASAEVSVLPQSFINTIRDIEEGREGGAGLNVFYASSYGSGAWGWSGDGQTGAAEGMARKRCEDQQARMLTYLPPWVPVAACERVWAGGRDWLGTGQ